MVTIVEKKTQEAESNPGRGCFYFTQRLYPSEEINLSEFVDQPSNTILNISDTFIDR